MTNLEKYRNEIEPYVFAGKSWGFNLSAHKVVDCDTLHCSSCLFNSPGCTTSQFNWLKGEYKEVTIDWSTIPVDTLIEVSDDGVKWTKRYFAQYDKITKQVKAWTDGATSKTTGAMISWNCGRLIME